MSFLESKAEGIKFQRIDGALDETLVDAARENTVLDEEGKTLSGRIADFFRSAFSPEEVEIEAKPLSSDTLTGLVIISEDERRFRDYMAASQRGAGLDIAAMGFGKKKTFVVNTGNKLVQNMMALKQKDEELAKNLAQHLYETALFAQKELPLDKLPGFLTRNEKLLEKLVQG